MDFGELRRPRYVIRFGPRSQFEGVVRFRPKTTGHTEVKKRPRSGIELKPKLFAVPANRVHFSAFERVANDGSRAIHLACTERLADRVALLLHESASVTAQNAEGDTALHISVRLFDAASIPLLLEAVGRSAALELLFTGRAVRAEEALRIGLVDAVLPKAELDARVDGVAASVSRLAPLTLRAAKLAAWRRAGAAEACAACYESRDYAEGIAAFEEKRRPTFEGR